MGEPPAYVACGKQLLRDGTHFADFASPEAASAVAEVLSNGQVIMPTVPIERLREIEQVLWS